MELRTMEQLEIAMIENRITNCAKFCRLAIEAGHADNAGHFAAQAVRASRELPEVEDLHRQAERFAEPMLRLAKAEDPAITRARQMVADGLASKQMQADLATFDRHERIIEQANTEGRTVGRTIHYYRDGALANLRRATQNDAATVRWSNEDFAERSKVAGGVLVIKREAA